MPELLEYPDIVLMPYQLFEYCNEHLTVSGWLMRPESRRHRKGEEGGPHPVAVVIEDGQAVSWGMADSFGGVMLYTDSGFRKRGFAALCLTAIAKALGRSIDDSLIHGEGRKVVKRIREQVPV